MLRLLWMVLGSGNCKSYNSKTGADSKRSPVVTKRLGANTGDSDDDDVRTVGGSSTSLYSESGDEEPGDAIMPPSPVLSPRSSASLADRPPKIGRMWPTASDEDDVQPGLDELYEQDRELYHSLLNLLEGFRGSSLRLCMRFQVRQSADGAPPLDLVVDVGPDGASARKHDPSGEWPVAPCTLSCERATLIGIIRGQSSPMNALLTGEVMVDDLGQLMAFSTCFDFEAIACCVVGRGRKAEAAGLADAGDGDLEAAEPPEVQPQITPEFKQSAWFAETEAGLMLV